MCRSPYGRARRAIGPACAMVIALTGCSGIISDVASTGHRGGSAIEAGSTDSGLAPRDRSAPGDENAPDVGGGTAGLDASTGVRDGGGILPGRKLTWSDEFDGPAGSAPDPTKWRYQTGGSGFGNNELEY